METNNKPKTKKVDLSANSSEVMKELFFDVEWGKKSFKKSEVMSLRYKDITIKNRFDFGENPQLIIRNIKPIKKPLPNIFKLLKPTKKQEV